MSRAAQVSVVIPFHNAQHTLHRAISSVRVQRLDSWELVLVDDGSTDGSRAIAEAETSDSRITLVTQEQQGQGSARNAGVAHAQADWVLFLDADDEIEATHLDSLVEATKASPVALAYSGGRRVFAGDRLGNAEFPPDPPHFRSLARRNEFFIHMCLLRKSVFDDVGGFEPGERYCEDWDLWQRVARLDQPVASTGQASALYHLHESSMSHDLRPMIARGVEIIARGHQEDPRLSVSGPWQTGIDPFWKDSAIFFYTYWACAVAVGARSYSSELLSHALVPPDDPKIEHLEATFRAGFAWAVSKPPDDVKNNDVLTGDARLLIDDIEALGVPASLCAQLKQRLAGQPGASGRSNECS